jgi:MarR family transcriptional regulator, organic hydroperoxide resistance regulator
MVAAASLSDPTFVFLRTIWALDHGLQSHSKKMEAEKGVTGPQRLILRILQFAPGAAPTELARILCFHKSTVSVILRRLEHAKLVRRAPNAADGRAVVLTLTAKGRQIAEERAGTVEAIVAKALAKMPARDVQSAQRVLDELARAFG